MFFPRKKNSYQLFPLSLSIIYLIFLIFPFSHSAIPTKKIVFVVDNVNRDFEYPVKTKLELTDSHGITQADRKEKESPILHKILSILEETVVDDKIKFSANRIEDIVKDASRGTRNLDMTESNIDPVIGRFRRNDKPSVTQSGLSLDYMSIYYAQRKAIMDKFKSQQREIKERLKKTKNLIAESKRLKEMKKTDTSKSDELPTVTQNPNIIESSNETDPTMSNVDFSQTTNPTIFNDTSETNPTTTESFFNSSDYESSSEIDPPSTTMSPIITETLNPSGNEGVEKITERPEAIETLEEAWRSDSVNLIPENEVDSNLTVRSLIRQELDNDTLIFNLGGELVNPNKNDSALDQLEKMFLWEVPGGSERIPRFDGGSIKTVNTMSENDRSLDSNDSLDALRFMVEIKTSPEVQIHKNITNLQNSRTIYRNSTHEIVEINGIVNSTRKITSASPDVDLPFSQNLNFTNPEVSGGGATESEWCEECPHDYRWGNCKGTLFYQHNIFLRNRGPSSIDATFGMTVQGLVSITCVEAIRFNQTRGIVTLISGGEGNDFAKLRIRGFQGEGFSYILKVWGVPREEPIADSNNP